MNGGPRTLFFGMIIAVVGALAQAACLGEMASMIPVAGAQYHWTFHMAPKRIKMFATWIQGWTTWFGYVALQAALANILVVQLESLISLNSTTYIAGGWKTSVLVIACAVVQGLVNVYAFRVVPWLEMISSILHVALFILVLVVFVVMAPKHSAIFLLEPMIESGWDHNPYVSWHLGMLTCIFSITGMHIYTMKECCYVSVLTRSLERCRRGDSHVRRDPAGQVCSSTGDGLVHCNQRLARYSYGRCHTNPYGRC